MRTHHEVVLCQFGVDVLTGVGLFLAPKEVLQSSEGTLQSSGGIMKSVPCWRACWRWFIFSAQGGAAIIRE